MTSGPPTAADLEVFLAERGTLLLRSAVLLAGSREAGEDLLQAALERMLRHWRAIDGDPEGYLRRTIYNLATDSLSRQRRWRDRLHQLQPPDPRASRSLTCATSWPVWWISFRRSSGQSSCCATGSSSPRKRPQSSSAARSEH